MYKKQKTINKKQIDEFIHSLLLVENKFGIKNMRMFFSSEDLGTLYLNNEKFINYRRVLQSIIKDLDSEIISPKTIEKLFQYTILKSLDLNNKQNSIPLDQRIKDSINSFEKSLNENPRKIFLYYPIKGIAKEGLPFKFGKVEFCIFSTEDYSFFENTVKNNWSEGYSKQMLLESVEQIKVGEMYEEPVAKIELNAIDFGAAEIIGIKDLTLSIDILNFYSDLIPYHDGFIFFPGESQQTSIEVPMLAFGEKPGVQFRYHRVGSIMDLPINKLKKEDRKNNLGLAKVSNLIIKEQNRLEERIISAMRWAGSATVEQDKEKSFLEYAISLETLILLDTNRSELTHRLRTRVAQLLSEDFNTCRKISDDINKLYKIRSDIVHDGKYQVVDSELALIRYYTKRSILRLLTDSEFDSMDMVDLLDWFEQRTFR